MASAEVAADGVAVVDAALASTTLQEGRYLIAVTAEGNCTLRILKDYSSLWGVILTFGVSFAAANVYIAASYAALPASGTAWDTATASSFVSAFAILNVTTA